MEYMKKIVHKKIRPFLFLQLILIGYRAKYNRIDGVKVSALALSATYGEFENRSCQAKDNTIGICCFSAKH
jgi:hypothetical protein